MKRPAIERLDREREKDRREQEILLARDLMKAFPELTRSEALRHAHGKLLKEEATR